MFHRKASVLLALYPPGNSFTDSFTSLFFFFASPSRKSTQHELNPQKYKRLSNYYMLRAWYFCQKGIWATRWENVDTRFQDLLNAADWHTHINTCRACFSNPAANCGTASKCDFLTRLIWWMFSVHERFDHLYLVFLPSSSEQSSKQHLFPVSFSFSAFPPEFQGQGSLWIIPSSRNIVPGKTDFCWIF